MCILNFTTLQCIPLGFFHIVTSCELFLYTGDCLTKALLRKAFWATFVDLACKHAIQ